MQKFLVPVIEKVVLALSDQQILTGLSIIIIGFVTQCSISAYRFAIVDDMALFSANVHLTEYLEDTFLRGPYIGIGGSVRWSYWLFAYLHRR